MSNVSPTYRNILSVAQIPCLPMLIPVLSCLPGSKDWHCQNCRRAELDCYRPDRIHFLFPKTYVAGPSPY